MDKSPISLPTDVSIITTYRCQMRCQMCNIWKYPTDPKLEISARDLEILPSLKFVNITGGEPFQRQDIEEIVAVSFQKAPRVVISTSGWHYEKIVSLAKKYPKIGIRVSIEGLSQLNDELRGRSGGFDRGLKLLLHLRELGVKDIGFGITVSNRNSQDMLELYKLSRQLGLEFATAAFHNSYYFHKGDNLITNTEQVSANFDTLIQELIKENSPKSWFRALFNLGLIGYINGQKRMLPCEAGSTNFFIEPYGDVFPCNGLEDKIWKESMGNIKNVSSFSDLWFSDQANRVRRLVSECPKNCWMVGTAAPVMKKYLKHSAGWVARNKLNSLLGKKIDTSKYPFFQVGQNPLQGDLDYSRFQSSATDQSGVESSENLPLIDV